MLYSTKVKLFPWIPNFVVKFITTKALVEVRILDLCDVIVGNNSVITAYCVPKEMKVVVNNALNFAQKVLITIHHSQQHGSRKRQKQRLRRVRAKVCTWPRHTHRARHCLLVLIRL